MGGDLFIVDERVQQASLVPGGVGDGSNHREVASSATVDFAVHIERLGKMGDLYAGADSADICDANSSDITGLGGDPLRSGVELAVGVLRANDRDIQVLGEPSV